MRPQYYNYNQPQHPHQSHPHPQHKFIRNRSNPQSNNIVESSTSSSNMERKSLAILEQKTKISCSSFAKQNNSSGKQQTYYANYSKSDSNINNSNGNSNININKRNTQTLPPKRTSSSIDPKRILQRGSWKQQQQQQQQISSSNNKGNIGSTTSNKFRSKTTTPSRSKSLSCNLQSPRSVITTTTTSFDNVEVAVDAFPSTPPVVSSSFPSTPPIVPSTPAAGIPTRSRSTRINNDNSKPERFQRSIQRKEQRLISSTTSSGGGLGLGKKKIKPADTRTSNLLLNPPPTPPTPIRDYNDDLFDDIIDDNDNDSFNEDDDEEEGEEVELGPGAYAITSPSPDTFFVSPRRSSSFAARPPQPPPSLTATCTPSSAVVVPSMQRSNSMSGDDYGNQYNSNNDEMLDDSYSYLDDDDELISEDEDDEYYGGSEEAELVVAAELSNDLEREIEERVRAQVMAEAAQATAVVVAVNNAANPSHNNNNSLLPPRVPLPPVSSVDIGGSSNKRSSGTGVHQRQLLPWKIEQEGATLKWVAIVQTNPNAKRLGIIERQQCELRFVAATKREAREIALAMATPRPTIVLQQQQQQSQQHQQKCCSLCQTNFSFFKRKKHTCVNCGIVGLCQGCTTSWSKAMVPSTYYCSGSSTDNSSVKICTVCDWSAKKFHQALLNGDIANARYLYKNHNVNLRNPYILEKNNKKKEVLYPIHAAILGGNLSLVKWLVVNRCCPLVSSRQSSSSSSQDFIGNNGGGGSAAASSLQPLLTSKGRSPVQLALNHLPILWYFVHDLKLNLMDDQLIKTVDPKLLLGHLTQIMVAGPYSSMMMPSSSSNNKNKNKHDDYDRKRKEKLLLLQQPKNKSSSSSIRRTSSFSAKTKASF